MAADPAPADAELARLLDAYGQGEYEFAGVAPDVARNPVAARRVYDRKEAARAALLAYLDRCYVRRDRLDDDGPWDTLPGEDQG